MVLGRILEDRAPVLQIALPAKRRVADKDAFQAID